MTHFSPVLHGSAYSLRVLPDWGNHSYTYSPAVVTNVREELLACRTTAWFGQFLNRQSPVYDIIGPDAVALLNKVCVNKDFAQLDMQGSRHALMCNEQGQLLADGLLIRTGEQSFRTYWLAPVLDFYVTSMGMNVEGRYVADEYFFQIDGPKSLEILEEATQTDLHDIKFARRKAVKCAGTDMTVIRLGMSGCLAYEVHGHISNEEAVFAHICEVGREYGMKLIGEAYCFNHTQGGYPNQILHYLYPYITSGDAMKEYFQANMLYEFNRRGSCANNPEDYYVTPFDVGWEYLINWDHDFIGEEALRRISLDPPAKPVTLEWNIEDVAKVFMAQFSGTEIEPPVDTITDDCDGWRDMTIHVQQVFAKGERVGRSVGRIKDYYHRRMISLAFIAPQLAVEGEEVTVLYGTPGTRQMEIRATVAPFPYYNEELRNETFDTEKIARSVR